MESVKNYSKTTYQQNTYVHKEDDSPHISFSVQIRNDTFIEPCSTHGIYENCLKIFSWRASKSEVTVAVRV